MEFLPLVNIVMVTFNQEKYIAQAIESVLTQKTTFSFKLIIGDDCSTDGTNFICRKYAEKYPEKLILIENITNLGLVRNYESVFNACTAKYIAILEGDDYWIDENKLQKQTDLLESNNEIGLVHTASYSFYEDYNLMVPVPREMINCNLKYQGYVYEKLLKSGNFIRPLTVMFRRNLLVEKIDFQFFVDNNFQTIDYALWLAISIHSKIVFINDMVGVYRVRSASISNNSSLTAQQKFLETYKKVASYYIDLYPVNQFSSGDIESIINESLFSTSLLYGDYQFTKLFLDKIVIRSIKMRIKYIFSLSRFTVHLYSFLSSILLRMRLTFSSINGDLMNKIKPV